MAGGVGVILLAAWMESSLGFTDTSWPAGAGALAYCLGADWLLLRFIGAPRPKTAGGHLGRTLGVLLVGGPLAVVAVGLAVVSASSSGNGPWLLFAGPLAVLESAITIAALPQLRKAPPIGRPVAGMQFPP